MDRRYIPGDRWVRCDECGFGYRLSQIQKGVSLRQKGHHVCPDCFDYRHPNTDWRLPPKQEGKLIGGNIGAAEGSQPSALDSDSWSLSYSLDHTSGLTAIDLGGDLHHGKLVGFPTDNTQWRSDALYFAPSSTTAGDYVNTGTPLISTFQDSHSSSFWIKMSDGQPAWSQYIFGSYNSATNYYGVWIATTGKLNVSYAPNATAIRYSSASATFENGAQSSFSHIVVVATSEGSIVAYKDGSLITADGTNDGDLSSATMSDYNTTHNVYVGALGGNSGYNYTYGGLIKKFKIYNKALTATEVSTLYSAES